MPKGEYSKGQDRSGYHGGSPSVKDSAVNAAVKAGIKGNSLKGTVTGRKGSSSKGRNY